MQIDLNPRELELLIAVLQTHSSSQMSCGMEIKGNDNEDEKFEHYSNAGETRALVTRLHYCCQQTK